MPGDGQGLRLQVDLPMACLQMCAGPKFVQRLHHAGSFSPFKLLRVHPLDNSRADETMKVIRRLEMHAACVVLIGGRPPHGHLRCLAEMLWSWHPEDLILLLFDAHKLDISDERDTLDCSQLGDIDPLHSVS